MDHSGGRPPVSYGVGMGGDSPPTIRKGGVSRGSK